MAIGIFLVVMGLLWVVSYAGLISDSVSQYFFPVIVIAVGLQIINNAKKNRSVTEDPNKQM